MTDFPSSPSIYRNIRWIHGSGHGSSAICSHVEKRESWTGKVAQGELHTSLCRLFGSLPLVQIKKYIIGFIFCWRSICWLEKNSKCSNYPASTTTTCAQQRLQLLFKHFSLGFLSYSPNLDSSHSPKSSGIPSSAPSAAAAAARSGALCRCRCAGVGRAQPRRAERGWWRSGGHRRDGPRWFRWFRLLGESKGHEQCGKWC